MSTPYTENRFTLIAVPDTDTVSTSIDINTSAEKAWELVGNFAGFDRFIDGLNRIEMTHEGVRSVRKKFFDDTHVVLEQLNSIDNDAMIMTWTLIYTSLDINNLWSSMRVEKISDNSCRVIWDIAGEPYTEDTSQEEFDKFLSGFATAALTNVKNIFETATEAA